MKEKEIYTISFLLQHTAHFFVKTRIPVQLFSILQLNA